MRFAWKVFGEEIEHLYNLCDEKGILLMVGFSCQWEWKGIFGGTAEDKYGSIITPEQIDVAAESWNDQIVWLEIIRAFFYGFMEVINGQGLNWNRRYLDVLKNEDPTPSLCTICKRMDE